MCIIYREFRVKDLLTGKTFREGEEAVIGDWDLMIFEEIRKKM